MFWVVQMFYVHINPISWPTCIPGTGSQKLTIDWSFSAIAKIKLKNLFDICFFKDSTKELLTETCIGVWVPACQKQKTESYVTLGMLHNIT